MIPTDRLIEIVKEYPILYDGQHIDSKNMKKKDQIWDEIGELLETNGDAIKRKWKNIRDTYMKHLRSISAPPGQSGKKNYSLWQWAKAMESFKPFLSVTRVDSSFETNDREDHCNHPQSLKTESNSGGDSSKEEDDSENQFNHQIDLFNIRRQLDNKEQLPLKIEEVSSLAPYANHRPNKKRVHREEDADSSDQALPVNRVSEYLQNKRKPTDMDAVELIFMGYASTVKSFSPRRQAITKMKIAQIILEQELQHYDEVAPASAVASSPTSCFHHS